MSKLRPTFQKAGSLVFNYLPASRHSELVIESTNLRENMGMNSDYFIPQRAPQRIPRHSKPDFLRNRFSRIFGRRSDRYIWIVLLGLLVLWSISYFRNVPPICYGLYLDLLGAIILGIGLVNGQEDILTKIAGNPIAIQKSIMRDTVDAIYGIGLLTTGMFVQLMATLVFGT